MLICISHALFWQLLHSRHIHAHTHVSTHMYYIYVCQYNYLYIMHIEQRSFNYIINNAKTTLNGN